MREKYRMERQILREKKLSNPGRGLKGREEGRKEEQKRMKKNSQNGERFKRIGNWFVETRHR